MTNALIYCNKMIHPFWCGCLQSCFFRYSVAKGDHVENYQTSVDLVLIFENDLKQCFNSHIHMLSNKILKNLISTLKSVFIKFQYNVCNYEVMHFIILQY